MRDLDLYPDIGEDKRITPFSTNEKIVEMIENLIRNNRSMQISLEQVWKNMPGKLAKLQQVYSGTLRLSTLLLETALTINSLESLLKDKFHVVSNNELFKAESKSHEEYLVYPFANELLFHKKTIPIIEKQPPIRTDKLKVALVVGESNILSMLPELIIHADLIICADLNGAVLKHNAFMLFCLRKANTIEEFRDLYTRLHPFKTINRKDKLIEYSGDKFYADLTDDLQSVEKHFLFSPERFQACKNAAEKLSFIMLVINMFNLDQCNTLSKILQEINALMVLLNLTNLQHYDHHNTLKHNPILLNNIDPKATMIMYSVGYSSQHDKVSLLSRVSFGVEGYFRLLNYSQTAYTPRITNKSISDELILILNERIRKIVVELKINEVYAPKILVINQKDYFGKVTSNKSLVLQKGLEADDPVQLDASNKLWIFLLKNLMPYWQSNWYYSEEILQEKNSWVLDERRAKEFLQDCQLQVQLNIEPVQSPTKELRY